MNELQATLDRLIALAKQSQKANCSHCGCGAIKLNNDVICIVGHINGSSEQHLKLGRLAEIVAMLLWGERQ